MASKISFFIFAFIFSTLDQSFGLAKIDLFPKALAPHSIFPEHLATIWFKDKIFATSNEIFCDLSIEIFCLSVYFLHQNIFKIIFNTTSPDI